MFSNVYSLYYYNIKSLFPLFFVHLFNSILFLRLVTSTIIKFISWMVSKLISDTLR